MFIRTLLDTVADKDSSTDKVNSEYKKLQAIEDKKLEDVSKANELYVKNVEGLRLKIAEEYKEYVTSLNVKNKNVNKYLKPDTLMDNIKQLKNSGFWDLFTNTYFMNIK